MEELDELSLEESSLPEVDAEELNITNAASQALQSARLCQSRLQSLALTQSGAQSESANAFHLPDAESQFIAKVMEKFDQAHCDMVKMVHVRPDLCAEHSENTS